MFSGSTRHPKGIILELRVRVPVARADLSAVNGLRIGPSAVL
jgi:hypothetical protein